VGFFGYVFYCQPWKQEDSSGIHAVYFLDLTRGEVMRKIDMRPDMQPASWVAGTFVFLHESYVFLHELRNGVKANGMLQAGRCGIRIHLIRIPGSNIF
jgi:hypothetical protein